MLFTLKSPLLLYPFRYFDPVRKRWIRARYVAERHEIAGRFAQWEITGPPEIRTGSATMFNPWAKLPARPAAHLPPVEEPPPGKEPPEREPPDNEPPHPPVEEPPVEDAVISDQLERFLVLLFLRRHITWCARSRRFAAMDGAARLFREIGMRR